MKPEALVLALLYGSFFLTLIIAAYTDLWRQKIYNWLTLPAIVLGIGLNLSLGTLGVPGYTLVSSLAGLGLGFGIFWFCYLAGGIGGGDVKLMAAVGAMLGFPFVVSAIFWSALVGSFMGMAWLIWQGRFMKGVGRSLLYMVRIRPAGTDGASAAAEAEPQLVAIPYGLAIALGTGWAWFLHTGLIQIQHWNRRLENEKIGRPGDEGVSRLARITSSLKTIAAAEERGVAILEFLIVFPLQLLFVMGIMQLALLYIGHQVLNYAAFTACRAALVGDLSDAGAEEDAHRAAAMVMSSVAGTTGVSGGQGVEVPGWGGLTRGRAAMAKTEVTTIDEQDGVVYVVVRHEYELAVPVVNRIFAYPWEEFMGPEGSGSNENVAASDRYRWPHLVIYEDCYLYRPWEPGEGSGTTWLPAIPGVGGLGGLFP